MDNLSISPLILYQEVSGIDGHLIFQPPPDSQVRIILSCRYVYVELKSLSNKKNISKHGYNEPLTGDVTSF